MTDEESGSRAERLRNRRAGQQTGEGSDDQPSQSDPDGQSQEAGDSEESTGRVKDEQVGTYMYILPDQKGDIDHQYNLLKAEYEYEYDRTFEKNRHFYPLLVQYGLDGLDGLDASEIQERLDSL